MKNYFEKLKLWFEDKLKLHLDKKSEKNIFRQKEIYYVNFGINIGSEFNGVRPALIFEESKYSFFRKNVIVFPITSFKKNKKYGKFDIRIIANSENGLKSDSIVKLFHIKDISKIRVKTKIGILEEKDFEIIKERFQKIYNKNPKK